MKPSNELYESIKDSEGYDDNAYQDGAGVWTIGWGTTIYPDGKKVKEGDTVDKAKADVCLRWEVDTKTKSVTAFVKNVFLLQNQFDALVSFAYNVGIGALENSTLLKKLRKNPNDPTIRDEFMKWNKITDPKTKKKIPSKGLTNRRKREADMYFQHSSNN
jgi:lysozyme